MGMGRGLLLGAEDDHVCEVGPELGGGGGVFAEEAAGGEHGFDGAD